MALVLQRAVIKTELFLMMSIEFFLANLFSSPLPLAIPGRGSGHSLYRLLIYYVISLFITHRLLLQGVLYRGVVEITDV